MTESQRFSPLVVEVEHVPEGAEDAPRQLGALTLANHLVMDAYRLLYEPGRVCLASGNAHGRKINNHLTVGISTEGKHYQLRPHVTVLESAPDPAKLGWQDYRQVAGDLTAEVIWLLQKIDSKSGPLLDDKRIYSGTHPVTFAELRGHLGEIVQSAREISGKGEPNTAAYLIGQATTNILTGGRLPHITVSATRTVPVAGLEYHR